MTSRLWKFDCLAHNHNQPPTRNNLKLFSELTDLCCILGLLIEKVDSVNISS